MGLNDAHAAQIAAHARTDADRQEVIAYAVSYGVPAAASWARVTTSAVYEWMNRLGASEGTTQPQVVTASSYPCVACPYCYQAIPMTTGNPGSATDRAVTLRAHYGSCTRH